MPATAPADSSAAGPPLLCAPSAPVGEDEALLPAAEVAAEDVTSLKTATPLGSALLPLLPETESRVQSVVRRKRGCSLTETERRWREPPPRR